MQKENVRKLRDVVEALHTATLTTVDDKYHLVSRPMAVRVAEFDGVVRLFAPSDARCVAHIAARAWVNISHSSPTASVLLAGLATVSADPDRLARYWHDGLNAWFPTGVRNVTMIEVTVFEGRSWTVAIPAAERLRERAC